MLMKWACSVPSSLLLVLEARRQAAASAAPLHKAADGRKSIRAYAGPLL